MLAAQSSAVSGIVFTVAVLATSLALVAGLAWASRRLLGLPVGALRTLIAGLLGFAAALILGRYLQAAQPGHAVAFFTVALGVPLIVAMIFIVAAEALVPTGTGPRPLEARSVGVVGVARGFAAAMREELDFRVEARNMAAVASTWPGQQRAIGGSVPVMLPALYEQLSSEHVLVIEWLDGVNLRAAGQLIDERGLERAELSRALLRSMVYQITEGGVFHADPHPGNILLLNDGRLALLDFGSVGRLDAQQRAALR
jgi:ABC1 atypical kinase-like domain